MKRKSIIISFLAIIIFTNIYFGLPRVKSFTGVDETLWSYSRIPKFWDSISKHKWGKTDINDKPGISLAIISGAGLPFIPNPKDYSKLQFKAKTSQQLNTVENIYYYLRLPIYLFSLLSLIFFYFLTKWLLGHKTALFATTFIGLSPILLGTSLTLNPDSLLWIFMPLSLISFLIYQKENNRKFLVLSGFILGLALLTKYVANLLFPFFLLLIFLKYVFDKQQLVSASQYFKKSILDYGLLVFSSFLTIFIFYPRLWIKLNTLLYTTVWSEAFVKIWPFFLVFLVLITIDILFYKSFFIRKTGNFLSKYQTSLIRIISFIALALIAFVFSNVYAGMKFYNFENIFLNPKGVNPLPAFLSSFFSLLFCLTPLIVILFILTIFLIIKSANKIQDTNLKYAFYFLLFILVYYLANSLSDISATVRYQIVIYPIASLLAAIGLNQIIKAKKFSKYSPKIFFYLTLIFIFGISFLPLWSIRPFYFSYASTLLPNQYILNPRDMGGGGWEASQYLNSLPNAKKLVVWSDKKQACEKFIGKCIASLKPSRTKNINFDYFITSAVGQSKTMRYAKSKGTLLQIGLNTIDPRKLYSSDKNYVFKTIIGGRSKNFIKIMNYAQAETEIPPPFVMPIISSPSFPNRTCNINHYGAIGDGKTLNTQFFEKAIADCSLHGGGKVEVPPGIWLTGAIHLRDNIDLDIQKGAEIRFSPDIKNYLPVVFSRFEGMEVYNYSPLIYANHCQNIAITGSGTLNGQRKLWNKNKNDKIIKQSIDKLTQMAQTNVPIKNRDFGKGSFFIQPSFIELINSNNILIDGIHIKNSPAWTIQPVYSHNIIIKNINIHNDGHNTDGIDIDSSQNIIVENSTFNTGDDAIAIKSGRDNDGLRVNKPSQNIIIRNCNIDFAHAALAIGSETSGGIKNVFAYNLNVQYADYGVRLKSTPGRGGLVDGVWANKINIHRATADAIHINLNYGTPTLGYDKKELPVFRNIHIDTLYCRRTHNAAVLEGLPGSPLENITLKNINISAQKGITATYLGKKDFQKIKINTN